MESRIPISSLVETKRKLNVKSFDLSFFQKQGFCIVNDVFTYAQCDELIAASQVFSSYQDQTLTPVMNPHELDARFYQAMCYPKILEIMEVLLSGKVSGLQSQFFFCRPGTRGFTRHQDNFYVQAKSDVFGSAWIALEDVTPKNGGLIVYAESHRETILPTESVLQGETFGQDPNANCQQVIIPTKYSPIDLSVPRGGVVFIHGHLIHASHNNSTKAQFRHVLLLTYIRKGEEFRSGFSAQRKEISLLPDRFGDKMLQERSLEYTH